MESDDKRIKYSDSPFAPDWAKAPEKRDRVITSFGKPIPQAQDNPHLDFGNQENSASKAKNDEADQSFKPTVEKIEEILWQDANDDIGVYCIMDGYWADGLYGRLLTSDDISWAHMFQGDVATRNIQKAPFIIALKRGHKLTKWLIEEGWGQGWGIYFTASTHKAHLLYGNPRINDKRFLPSNEEQLKLGNLTQGPEDPLWKMRRHFRQFSDVYLESENKIVDFRYYDPNTFATYVHSCNADQIQSFLAPICQVYYQEIIYMPLEPVISFLSVLKIIDNREIQLISINLHNNTETMQATSMLSLLIKSKAQKNYLLSISPQQQDAFKAKERSKFIRKITENLSHYIDSSYFISYQELLSYVLGSMNIVDKLHIKLEWDILNFIKCQLHYGPSFYKKSTVMSNHFANPKRNPKQPDYYLAHWVSALDKNI